MGFGGCEVDIELSLGSVVNYCIFLIVVSKVSYYVRLLELYNFEIFLMDDVEDWFVVDHGTFSPAIEEVSVIT